LKLPVDPERLLSRFPALTDEDLQAYAAVTARVLADPRAAGRVLAECLALAQRAREKDAQGHPLAPAERDALAYARAMEKMQRG
jgi:hypothetical protein